MQNFLQLYPSKKFVITTDKLKKDIFDTNDDSTERDVVESERSDIVTPLDVRFSSLGCLNAFDELVFDVCMSEQYHGNNHTTLSIIHRAMGGSKTNFYPAEKEKILQSIRKLADTWIKFDCSDCFKKFGYNDGKSYKYEGYLLPLEFVMSTVNGQLDSAVIHFLRKTPLLDVATMKGQIATTYDFSLLNVPKLKNTENVLIVKGYLLRRIIQTVGSHKPHKKHFTGRQPGGKFSFKQAKKLPKIIKLDTLFSQCGLSDADKWQKQDVRKTITKILDHFMAKGIITEWRFTKKDGKFYSITFEFS